MPIAPLLPIPVRTTPISADPKISATDVIITADELKRYRGSLERLQRVLPLLEVQLRVRRARLDSERAHLEAASEWVTTSKAHL